MNSGILIYLIFYLTFKNILLKGLNRDKNVKKIEKIEFFIAYDTPQPPMNFH